MLALDVNKCSEIEDRLVLVGQSSINHKVKSSAVRLENLSQIAFSPELPSEKSIVLETFLIM